MNNSIEILNQWFEVHCDGDWEHENGIKIETMDDPGWSLSIDLTRTCLEEFSFNKEFESKTSEEWFSVKTENLIYKSYGNSLSLLIRVFHDEFFMGYIQKSNFEFTIYEKIPHLEENVWRPLNAKLTKLDQFTITKIPDMHWVDLKVTEVSVFEKLNKNTLLDKSLYKIGQSVNCKSMKMYDYPALVILLDLL